LLPHVCSDHYQIVDQVNDLRAVTAVAFTADLGHEAGPQLQLVPQALYDHWPPEAAFADTHWRPTIPMWLLLEAVRTRR
jgi:hypothetical protein